MDGQCQWSWNGDVESWRAEGVACFQGLVLKCHLGIIEWRRLSLSSNSKLNTTLWVWWFAAKCQYSSMLMAYDRIILPVFGRKQLFGLNPACGWGKKPSVSHIFTNGVTPKCCLNPKFSERSGAEWHCINPKVLPGGRERWEPFMHIPGWSSVYPMNRNCPVQLWTSILSL